MDNISTYHGINYRKQKKGSKRNEKGFMEHIKVQHQGIGLKNVKRVVAQYDGDMQCEWKDGIFYTKIMLSIPEVKR